MHVKLVSKTAIDPAYLKSLIAENPTVDSLLSNSEGLMAYTARVSSPNQTNPSYANLLSYCIKNCHWSVFELVDCTFEIVTSRAIAQQILRHRSFTFQEFSQRYAKASLGYESYEARRQDTKNRQNSIDDMTEAQKLWFANAQKSTWETQSELYEDALAMGIAKEQARFLLPLNTTTKLYMKGSLRSWIHYISLRSENGTQKEHADIAKAIKRILTKTYPTVAEALDWNLHG